MSREHVKQQATRLSRPGATVRCVDDGENVVVILERYTPPNAERFAPQELQAMAFLVPAAFPDACPDATGFYVKPATIKAVATDGGPQNTSEATLLGEQWRKFSWAPKTFVWDGTQDTLETHLTTIEKRFLRGV